jgi:nicotinamidase-related amidase
VAGRVWEKYLSPQDLEHERSTADKGSFGFGERPALLLIDVYRWVFGDKPEPLLEAIKTWPGSCGLAGWEALPHLQRLLAEARATGIPVIYSTGLEREGIVGWAKSERGTPRRTYVNDPAMAERRRRMNEIVDEVAPQPGEFVVKKSSPSPFWGTPLMGHLTAHSVDTLLVTGESTSGCVRAAVIDACSNRLRVNVVEECVFDRTEASHAINLYDMEQKYADVISVDKAVDYLRRLRGEKAEASERELVGAR